MHKFAPQRTYEQIYNRLKHSMYKARLPFIEEGGLTEIRKIMGNGAGEWTRRCGGRG